MKYDPETSEILETYQQTTGPTDAIAIQHDVDYGSCSYCEQKHGEDEKKCKHVADRKMVKQLDSIPWKDRQWRHTAARNVINTKQKLGLGVRRKK